MITCKNIIESSNFPMAATMGPAHSLSYVNTAFCELNGKESHELLGHPISESMSRSMVPGVVALFDRIYLDMNTGSAKSINVSDPERHVVCQSCSIWAIPRSDELAGGLMIQMSDYTEAGALKEDQEQIKDEMREINERLLLNNIRQHELAEMSAKAQIELTKALDRERSISVALQYSTLWTEPEDLFPGLAMATIYEAALDEALVGGDYFDAVSLPNGQVMFAVGDVSGKGLKAAARTVEAKYVLRVFAQDYKTPAEAMARLNDYICNRHGGTKEEYEKLIVLLLAFINPKNGSTILVSAGAEPPFIVRTDGMIEEIPATGMMLGINPGITYAQIDGTLKTGDVLVLATDGITEAHQGTDFFGYERIGQIVREAHPSLSLHDIAKSVVDAARAFAGGQLHDDVCILLVRRK